jgi:transposase
MPWGLPKYGHDILISVQNEADLPSNVNPCRALCSLCLSDSLHPLCYICPSIAWRVRGAIVEPTAEFAQLQMSFTDQTQRRYEVIRPLLLFEDRTATQRAQETHIHPDTVRTFMRRFRQQGMLGLLPNQVEVSTRGRASRVPEVVRLEIAQLKALYSGFHYREVVRIIFYKCSYRLHPNTVKQLWQQRLPPVQGEFALGDYHGQRDRYQARVQVIKLYYQGWNKLSISRVLHVSRPTVDRWIHRFEAEYFAGLVDKSCAPKAPARKVWLPLMLEVYHLQKRHPDAGGFRIWSLLARTDVSVRTVERIMALNRQVYDDIPHRRIQGAKKAPTPHPYKATAPHEFWFIDGRKMDFALEGIRWWSMIVLDGYSRTMLAGMVAPAEASWVALLVLYTACLRYGTPETLISDSGGAFTSNEFEAVCHRLQLHHEPIESTKGESYLNWMETHFNVQRRLYDYQFSLTQTPAEFEQAHQAFMELYNTTAHLGLLKDQFDPPIPLVVLGEAKGRTYSPEELGRKFSHALFPRTTNRYGCVTLHHYHFYVEAGVPKTQVWLWVSGEQLRAVLNNVVLAEYHCRYDWRERQVTDIRDGVFYTTRFASPQGALIPLNPQELLVVYRSQALRRQARQPFSTQQLVLSELIRTG